MLASDLSVVNFAMDVRVVFVNALACNSRNIAAKKVLASFEAVMKVYGTTPCASSNCRATQPALRGVALELYAAMESYFFRKSEAVSVTQPMDIDMINNNVHNGIVRPDAFQAALNVIATNAVIYHPDPMHAVRAAARVFNSAMTHIVSAVQKPDSSSISSYLLVDIGIHKMLAVIKHAMGNPLAGLYFNLPDQKIFGMTNCSDVIKQCMDLGTIADCLQGGHYAEKSLFAADIRLVFSNAKLYNTHPAHPVHAAAEHLEALIKCSCLQTCARTAAFWSGDSLRSGTEMKLPVRKMRRILGELRKKENAPEFFLGTFHPPMLGLENRERLVKGSMSLIIIEEQLQTYRTLSAFSLDVRCVFKNALKIVPDSKMTTHKAANVLLRLFEDELGSIITQQRLKQINKQAYRHAQQTPSVSLLAKDTEFPLLYPKNVLQGNALDSEHVKMAQSWRQIANDSSRPCRDVHPHRHEVERASTLPSLSKTPAVLNLLWQISRAESLARRDAGFDEVRVNKEHIVALARDCEERSALLARAHRKDMQLQHERDLARRHAREVARRHREEIEQTVDLDRQRIAVSSFLEKNQE